ncbi:hypothetical protein QE152_g36636 [Popillia japonica]|uniref:Uncharacterized protein n=1 Tax=Popillia japonica TaxID=7064 RepID=A0AAW1ID50_POPJA
MVHRQLTQRKKTKEESYQEYVLNMTTIGNQGNVEEAALIEHIIATIGNQGNVEEAALIEHIIAGIPDA